MDLVLRNLVEALRSASEKLDSHDVDATFQIMEDVLILILAIQRHKRRIS